MLTIVIGEMMLLKTTGGADPIMILLNYGALGIMLVLVLSGFVKTKSEVDNRDKQLEEKNRQIADQQRMIDSLMMSITGQTLPAMARSTQVLENLPKGEAAIFAELQKVVGLLEGVKDSGSTHD